MLRALRIQNFALIDALNLSFNEGFTVITGETGSGKSILLGALNLILGERSDFSLIGPAGDKAIVEVDCELHTQWKSFFNENDLDFELLTTIRREIHSSGKSRAFINDTPVSLSTLKELSLHLISIHSQYNTLELKNTDYQLQMLDTLADLTHDRASYETNYFKWKALSNELEKLKSIQRNANQRIDYLDFQVNELVELQLENTDYSALESEYKLIESAEDIQRVLQLVNAAVDEDNGINDQLNQLFNQLSRHNGVSEDLSQLTERLKAVSVELSDLSKDAMRLNDQMDYQPHRLVELEDKINRYNHVLRKHQVSDQPALIKIWRQFEAELNGTSKDMHRMEDLENEVNASLKSLQELANSLHQKRSEATETLSINLKSILTDLKLPETQLTFQLARREALTSSGNTDLTILFSANKGMSPVPVEKAASGGELSRLMLALQKMISTKMQLPTVLFDEIDTGVSGEVAEKMGKLLKEMGTTMQLMAITHLPQVASKGTHHLRVEKSIKQDTTVTNVRSLSDNEREMEIARLMSGEEITDAALVAARQLMNS
jgi:DNA repair protein RecN (Recombination protein N)